MGTTIASDPLAAVSTAPELPMPTLPPFELELSRRKRPMTDLGCLGLFIPPFFLRIRRSHFWRGFILQGVRVVFSWCGGVGGCFEWATVTEGKQCGEKRERKKGTF